MITTPGVFPAKSPCEVNAAGIAHVDVQECKIIGRKVFDRAGIAERIKVRRDAAFFRNGLGVMQKPAPRQRAHHHKSVNSIGSLL